MQMRSDVNNYASHSHSTTHDLPSFQQVFARARNAFASGKTKDVFFRKSQLKSLDKMLVENQKVLIEAVHKDLRKPAFEVIAAEIDVIRNEIRSILISIDRLVKPETVPMTIATSLDNTVIVYEPFGSVFIIGAWNYPLQLTLAPLVGAISAGNCAVVKPSEISVVTSRVIAELLPQYLDRDCYQVVEGGAAETTQLLQQKWDYIFYTGSPRVGKIVYEAAAKNLVPVTLELGGKSPCWFDDSITDFETALKRVVWGKLLNCGQTCVAPDYLICTKAVQDKVVQAIPGILKNFYGESIAASSDYPRIVTENHFNRLVKMIESTKGKIVIGGTFNREDKFIAPTVVTDVPLDDVLMSEELFGPILPIVTVNSETEAIDFIKKGEKPLAMYIFTNKESVKQRFIKETSAGSMAINDTILQLTGLFPLGFSLISVFLSADILQTNKQKGSHVKEAFVNDACFLFYIHNRQYVFSDVLYLLFSLLYFSCNYSSRLNNQTKHTRSSTNNNNNNSGRISFRRSWQLRNRILSRKVLILRHVSSQAHPAQKLQSSR